MAIKYMAIDSVGEPFEAGETRTVDVTNEALSQPGGFEGDLIEYTATVKDSTNAALPTAFFATLKADGFEVMSGTFQPSVYNPVTFLLTLEFTVPAVFGTFTIKLTSEDQII